MAFQKRSGLFTEGTPRLIKKEARQRYFSYRAMLVAIVSQNSFVQKNPRVRNSGVRNSGSGNGCANFMGGRKNAFFLQENLCP